MNPNQDPQTSPSTTPSPLTPPDASAPQEPLPSEAQQPVAPAQQPTFEPEVPAVTGPAVSVEPQQAGSTPIVSPLGAEAVTPNETSIEPAPVAAPVAPQPSLETADGQANDLSTAAPSASAPSAATAVFAATATDASAPSPENAASQPAEDPGKTLGIVGFVLSLLGGGLVSLIISVLARNKSKKAGHSNSLALAGIILSVIGMIVSALFLALFVAGMMKAAEYCQENGTTTRGADGSVSYSYNCGNSSNSDSTTDTTVSPKLN